MTTTRNFCLLMKIQPMILRFANMLASVLQLEVEIVDDQLTRVAGTGPYGNNIGRKLEGDSRLLRYVIDSKKEKVVTQTGSDPICLECCCKESCKERAFLGIPILLGERCIGVISLVALSNVQQQHLQENLQEVCDYVRHICTLFVAKLLGEGGGLDDTSSPFIQLMESMDQGCLLLDEHNQVRYVNHAAIKHLNCEHAALLGHQIGIRPLLFSQQGLRGHIQHLLTWNHQERLIIGQLHHIKKQQLFLMAFHQSHASPRAVASDPISDAHFKQLVGNSQPMTMLKKLLRRVANSPSSVFIRGESGTGKEVVARAIHNLSPRSEQPFIAINCAAIPEQLLESELFGYTKGAFTGALNNGKKGLIQAAHHGTLFLDEIGDMPLMMQAKLLRVLESREVTPIGASHPIAVDIRLVAATHRDLEQYIAEGRFREDLFYRINVIPLMLPPLREREGDVELLIHYFINLHTRRMGVVYPGLTAEVVSLLNRYCWPGNVRELSNLIEYLINVTPAGEVIDSMLLPPNITKGVHVKVPVPHLTSHAEPSIETLLPTPSLVEYGLDSMEKQMIEGALLRLGNKKAVAQSLGIGIATLYRKIKKYEISVC